MGFVLWVNSTHRYVYLCQELLFADFGVWREEAKVTTQPNRVVLGETLTPESTQITRQRGLFLVEYDVLDGIEYQYKLS